MAVKSYDEFLKGYQGLTPQQQQNFRNMTANDSTIQGYLQQYDKSNTVYTPTTTQNVQTPTYTYGDTGGASNAKQYSGQGVGSAGNYNYNPNLKTSSLQNGGLTFGSKAELAESRSPGYLEQRNNAIANALYNEGRTDRKSVENYLLTFDDYKNYDDLGRKNTVDAIMNRFGAIGNLANQGKATSGADLNALVQNEIMNYTKNASQGVSGLMGGAENYYSNFWDAVNGKLQKAYGIDDLDAFKERYPEQYESLQQALSNVEGVWNATDPNSRQMLDGVLQSIIGTGVGAGSDVSKLKVLESSIMDKFENPDQIKQDAQNVIKLQTEGKNTKAIANEMGISEDQVQQLILLANGLDSKAGEYYKLKSDVAKDITEPYDTKIARLEEEKKIALDRANRNVEWLKTDYDTNYERQQQQNDINAHNMDAIAGRTGLGLSKRGIEGLNYTNQQAKNILDDITKNYDRNNKEMADGIADIIRNWQWNNEDLTKACEDALTKAKNSFTSNMLAIQQQYGTVGLEAQQYLSKNVQAFIEQAENIYDNALARQQNNLTNLINNVSNLNALALNNLNLRQQTIKQFQAESLNMNRSQLQTLATQLGMDSASYGDLVQYQAQAVANELNGYVPGAGAMFQQEIQSQLDKGYTPTQAISNIMNSDEFKQATAGSGNDNWAMSGGIMYNKSTGEYKDLNGNSWTKLNDNTLYNPATGQTMNINRNNIGGVIGSQGSNYASAVEGLQDFASQHALGSRGGQCGHFVNDYLQSLGLDRIFTDPITDKTKNINGRIEDGYIPQVGDVAIMDSPSAPEYGHVAIVTGVESDGKGGYKITTLESNKKGEESVFTRTFTPSKSKYNSNYVYGYYHPEVQGGNAGGMSSNRTYATDIDQVDTAYERSIKSLIPTKLQDNVAEAERINAKILKMWNQGLSAEDAVLQYYGFDVKDEKDRELALSLADTVRQLPDDTNVGTILSYVSQKLNKKQYQQAISKVENEVRTQAKKNEPDGYFDESTAVGIIKKANELIELANSLPEDIGVFEGTMQKFLGNLKSSDASKLQTAIAYLTDEQRLKQVGSNVSEHELEMVKNWIPQINDRTDTFMNKIQQMKANAIANVNAWRTTYGLPALDENSMINNGNRSSLYIYGQPLTKGLGNGTSMGANGGRGNF